MDDRIPLSIPDLGGGEWTHVKKALDENWVSSVGPAIEEFEAALARYVGTAHAVAVSSGTAALHLAMRVLGVQQGDEVLCPTLTFIGTAAPVVYQQAEPVFVDSEVRSWNVDPELLAEELSWRAASGKPPKAVIVVHLYGQPVDMRPILEVAEEHGVPVIEDAAESLGATFNARQTGSLGRIGCFSFNGNKIITTGGGGMLVTDDAALAKEARYLSTQARDPGPEYVHQTVGYNYRLTNVQAAIGLGQMEVLDQHVSSRRRIAALYRERLSRLPGITVMPETPWGQGSCWMSNILVDPAEAGLDRDALRTSLLSHGIETRPLWMPLHMQPCFRAAQRVRGEVAKHLHSQGLSLPSTSSLSDEQVGYVCERIEEFVRHAV